MATASAMNSVIVLVGTYIATEGASVNACTDASIPPCPGANRHCRSMELSSNHIDNLEESR